MSEPSQRPFWHLRRRAETVNAEVDEELRHHLELRTEELKALGLSEEEARREAVRQFGDLDATRQYCRREDALKDASTQRALMLGDFVRDLHISLRGLRRAPAMTATIVITVSLGIGATAAIFAAIHAALLRPLPYAEPDRLVRIYTDAPPNRFRFSVVDYLALDSQQTTFQRIAGYTPREMAFSDGAVAERLTGRVVTWTYFGVLGIRPVLGRDFTAADCRLGSPPTVIVSYGFWQRRLGSAPDVVGRAIRLDGADHTVVAVLPREVGPLERRQDFFVAAQWQPPRRKGPFLITVVGRLRPGVDASAASSELRAIDRRLFPLWKASYQDERATWGLLDLRTQVTGDVRVVAGLALAAVALVWLIACVNASNLLIARVTSRRRELAIRAALGASRGRVVRHLLAETTLLACAAAVIGALVGLAGARLLRGVGANYFPRTQEIAFDAPVLVFLVLLTVMSALLFGLVPALHGTGGPVDESLRAGGRSSTGSAHVTRLRRLLVATQFAIATPLLVVAVSLSFSLRELGRVDLGFDPGNILSGSISLPAAQYTDAGRVMTFWDELQRRIQALPGVSAVAYADGLPPDNVGNFNNFDLEEQPAAPGKGQPVTPWVDATPDYFRLLGLRLIDGRLLDARDGQGENLDAVVVDRAWARRFFPNQSAVGKRFREGGCTTCPWTTVVGVVGEVKYAGLDAPDQGTVYTPMAGRSALPERQAESRVRFVVVRTTADPLALLPAVRRIVASLDPSLPFSDEATMDDLVAQSLERPRSLSLLVGAFAVVALVLSLIGIYGVMSYYVQQHAREISLRLALGGGPGSILRLVLRQSMTVVGVGVSVGIAAALGLARLTSSLMFRVNATDATTLTAVAAGLLTAALLACVFPARRAVAAPPAAVLHSE
jgi:putative ABC transport system permease protein